ncbi:MAG: WXG100 family type VII secretion target [Lachnospiraceae bacterium]|nr:WXG100 family type VII secretion target [Lachnospiraceae bacterium]
MASKEKQAKVAGNANELEDVIAQITNIKKGLDEQLTNFQTAVKKVKEDWSGNAKEKFDEATKEDIEVLKQLCEEAGNYIAELTNIKNTVVALDTSGDQWFTERTF